MKIAYENLTRDSIFIIKFPDGFSNIYINVIEDFEAQKLNGIICYVRLSNHSVTIYNVLAAVIIL